MILHYDYITKNYADRRSMVEEIARAVQQDPALSFDHIAWQLHHQGFFPAMVTAVCLMSMHQAQGQQTFVLGPHLANMLEHTDLRDIKPPDIRLPYPVFYVALTDCTHRIWGGSRTQWHTVKGFYTHLSDRAFTIHAWGGENERSIGTGDDAHIWVRLNLEDTLKRGEDLETAIFHLLRDRKNEQNDPIIDPYVLDENDKPVLPAVVEGSQNDGITDEVRSVQNETLTALFRIVVNLSLYLASPEPETERYSNPHSQKLRDKLNRTKSKGKRKKLERQLDSHSKATIIFVGKSIERTVGEQVREYGSVKAHWVRGHYHHYWIGKGRATRVRKWIMPYPKGLQPPEKRTYEVKDKTDHERATLPFTKI